MIRLTAQQPRKRGRGLETAAQAAERARFDQALVAILSDAGLRRSEAAALTWGDVQRWDDGSGRITVVRSKTDAEAQGAVVAITPVAMKALDAIRPAGVGGGEKVFGLSESQIARRVKAIAKAAGLADWEYFSGHSGRVGMARRMAQKRRPHPRDRAPGPLETGRPHGRPLHPRRVRRVGAAVSLNNGVHMAPYIRTSSRRQGGAAPRIHTHRSSTYDEGRRRAVHYEEDTASIMKDHASYLIDIFTESQE